MALDVAAVYEEYGSYLRGMAYNLVGPDAAEDLLQDAFLQVWVHREQYSENGRLKSWLCTIVHNTAMDQLRKEHHHRTLAFTEFDNLLASTSVEATVMARLSLMALRPRIAALPPQSQKALREELLHGYHWPGHSKSPAMRVALSRARKTLRDSV